MLRGLYGLEVLQQLDPVCPIGVLFCLRFLCRASHSGEGRAGANAEMGCTGTAEDFDDFIVCMRLMAHKCASPNQSHSAELAGVPRATAHSFVS